ncbi:Precorrin-6Y C(5,15)-methyltransferase decarboxylating [Halomonadaceae bacterium LMG 33818]|uniref:precorrin-6y C5,15-methyltransferase (decarboxylating) subunit CbiE n=1 Tax=Cernens ardua TaxID=3402176 RepID=UPI003EDBDD50
MTDSTSDHASHESLNSGVPSRLQAAVSPETSLPASSPWLTIIGVNEDGVEGLSGKAKEAISKAAWVIGGKRHLAHVHSLIEGRTHEWTSPLSESLEFISQLQAAGQAVVVLASGDPFFYGIGSVLTRFIPFDEMVVLPAPSALTLACAVVGWAQSSVNVVSLCGRPLETLGPHLEDGRKLLVLTSGRHAPADIVTYLRDHHYGDSLGILLEALGGPAQRVLPFKVNDFEIHEDDINPLNMLALTLSHEKSSNEMRKTTSLPDAGMGLPGRESALFQHDGQITRRDIRALSISRLQPRSDEVLWDLGAGSGAISIEWLLSNPSLRAVAVEQHRQRAASIRYNAEMFNVSERLTLMEGSLKEKIPQLEGQPDAVFIGGGASATVIELVIDRLPSGGRLVLNAVTLQTEQLVAEFQQKIGGELTRIALEHLTPLGKLSGWTPARTIVQWYWKKP